MRSFLWVARCRTTRTTYPGNNPTFAENGADNSFTSVWSFSGWGLPCQGRHRPRGELLPHHFTLTDDPKSVGGIFSVALSLGSLPVGVTHHPVLWSSDFPRHGIAMARPLHPLTVLHGIEPGELLKGHRQELHDQRQDRDSACHKEEIAQSLLSQGGFSFSDASHRYMNYRDHCGHDQKDQHLCHYFTSLLLDLTASLEEGLKRASITSSRHRMLRSPATQTNSTPVSFHFGTS